MFKFLTPYGTTVWDGVEFAYNLPGPGEKYSAPTFSPNMAEAPDGKDCGAGGVHLMNALDARYAPQNWWPWWAKPEGLVLGSSAEKTRCQGVRLRRITPPVLWRYMRLKGCTGANLTEADLREANLRGASLEKANLRGANLIGANLIGAYLIGAYLTEANLRWASLEKANLRWASLIGANLRGADLTEANLIGASLEKANLRGANLERADLREANLRWASLEKANLRGAKLTGAIWNDNTRWPDGYKPPA